VHELFHNYTAVRIYYITDIIPRLNAEDRLKILNSNL